jgi:hypothetical protein
MPDKQDSKVTLPWCRFLGWALVTRKKFEIQYRGLLLGMDGSLAEFRLYRVDKITADVISIDIYWAKE